MIKKFYQCTVYDAMTGLPVYSDSTPDPNTWVGSEAFYEWWLANHCSSMLTRVCEYVVDDGCSCPIVSELSKKTGWHPDIVLCSGSPIMCSDGTCVAC